MTDDLLADLAEAGARVRDSRKAYETHIAERDAAMEKAADTGHDYFSIARHAGLSPDRARVVIEGRRKKARP